MNSLQKVFSIQKKFTEKFIKDFCNKDLSNLNIREKETLTKEYILNIAKESFEVLDCIKFKTHRDEFDKELIITNLHEELIDVSKFLIGLMIIWDFDEHKFLKEFENKSEIVELRYQQEITFKNFKHEKIIVIDIDGVLNYWPLPLIDYTNKTYFKIKNHIKNWEDFLQLSISQQDEIKNLYRQSGHKRIQPINEQFKIALKQIKKNFDIKILILSSRPYEKYLRIFHDTKYWLDKNKIPYDGIIFDQKKHRKLLTNLNNIVLFIDDDKDYVRNANNIGVNSLCFKNKNIEQNYYDNTDDLQFIETENNEKIYNSIEKFLK